MPRVHSGHLEKPWWSDFYLYGEALPECQAGRTFLRVAIRPKSINTLIRIGFWRNLVTIRISDVARLFESDGAWLGMLVVLSSSLLMRRDQLCNRIAKDGFNPGDCGGAPPKWE
jgi:hypothetical protein